MQLSSVVFLGFFLNLLDCSQNEAFLILAPGDALSAIKRVSGS